MCTDEYELDTQAAEHPDIHYSQSFIRVVVVVLRASRLLSDPQVWNNCYIQIIPYLLTTSLLFIPPKDKSAAVYGSRVSK